MTLDIAQLIADRRPEQMALYERYVNPQMARVLKTINFNKTYTRAEGATIYDADGNRYIDFLGGWGVINVGRNHPTVVQVLQNLLGLNLANMVQMDSPILCGLLAEKLLRFAPPGIEMVHFTNSGTETTEAALKFSRSATGRERIVYCQNGYHGLTYGSLSVMGSEFFREGFAPFLPACHRVPFNNLEELERELSRKDVAAFLVEPIQGGGVIIPDAHYLPEAQRLCKKYGTLLVTDEIQTGLGRTGKFFAFEHWGVEPDIILLAKSLGGGLVPVGALLTRRDIYNKVYHRMERCMVNRGSFCENNLAMAAGLATLHVIESEKLLERCARMGEFLTAELLKVKESSEFLKEVRGKGLMIAVEFGEPKSLALKMTWKLLDKAVKGLFAHMIVIPLLNEHHILTEVAGYNMDVIKLLPPLNLKEEEASAFVSALSAVMKKAQKFPGGLWDLGFDLVKHALGASR